MANKFIDIKDVVSEGDYLSYINYDELKEEHKEFLRSDLWDVEFLEAPHAVYFPGNALLKRRIRSANPSFNAGMSELMAIIRQFYIHQTVRSGQSNGTISLDYQDREDQVIRAFLWDWYNKISDHETRFSFRKEDTQAVIKLTEFNSTRRPIAEFVMYSCQPTDGAAEAINKPHESEDPADNGQYTSTLSFEHYTFRFLNL
jgi:hypothetical protein